MTLVVAAPFAVSLALPALEWSEIVVPLVVFIVWLINQIAGANKPKPGAPRPQAGRPAVPNPKQARGPLEEVEQFLREARKAMDAQQRPQQMPPPASQQQQRAAAQRAKQTARQQKPAAKKVEKPAPRKSPLEASRLKPQSADRDESRLRSSVAQHVQEHLGGSKFDERAGRLSHLQQAVDQDIGAHVSGVFGHSVGSLAVQRDAVADARAASGAITDATDPAAQIAAMIRDPQSLRNAIILQEILQPPTHRW